jgi:hypothetical protein
VSPRRAPPHSGVLAVAFACKRPEPLDLAWTAQIAYPFAFKGRSTVDP